MPELVLTMAHDDGIVLSLELSIMLSVGLLLGQLMKRLRLPIVVGELLGGIVLGPTVLGRVAPDLFVRLFPSSGEVAIGRRAFVQLGLLCFLFAAGLEMNVPRLRRLGRSVVATSALGIVVPFVAGCAMVLGDPEPWASHVFAGGAGNALFMGTALCISALPVIARVLMDLGLTRHELGTVVLSAATLDDLVGWSLFAAILGMNAPTSERRHPAWLTMVLILGFAAFVLTAGRWGVQRMRAWVRSRVTWPGGLIGVAALLWLVAAAVAEWIGVHAIVGAFLVGLMLAQGREERDPPTEVVTQFAVGVFAPIYFVSMGLRTDFGSNFDVMLVLAVFSVACFGKIVGATAGARLGGMPWRDALAVGFGMNARGAMEMILASVALEHGLIDERLFVALVVMALLTSLLSGPVMSRLLASPSEPAARPAA
jgi:Kef-type K+ transport system membrane component KefB